MKKRVTIQDIADALGISRNTVSKAFNNSDGLAEATREKILQKAIEMGYKQFSYVRDFAERAYMNESETDISSPGFKGEIAFLSPVFITTSHFGSLMLDCFQRELLSLGYTLNTHRVSPENLRNRTMPVTFVREHVKGIICLEMFDRGYDEMLCGIGIPTLFVDTPVKNDGWTLNSDQLYMENTTGILKLVTGMIQIGKKRIGFIGDYEHCQSFFERYMAFRGAMLMANVPVNDKWIIKDNQLPDMDRYFEKLRELPDLFICANDFVALHAMKALQDIKKSIPEDVMIAGFDDAPESRLLQPPLTTVHIHAEIMAYTATQLLISRIEEPTLNFRTVHTETELIYRESAPLNL